MMWPVAAVFFLLASIVLGVMWLLEMRLRKRWRHVAKLWQQGAKERRDHVIEMMIEKNKMLTEKDNLSATIDEQEMVTSVLRTMLETEQAKVNHLLRIEVKDALADYDPDKAHLFAHLAPGGEWLRVFAFRPDGGEMAWANIDMGNEGQEEWHTVPLPPMVMDPPPRPTIVDPDTSRPIEWPVDHYYDPSLIILFGEPEEEE